MSTKLLSPTAWATAADVAARAGVSRSAVSRTFTLGASVAPATRQKVMKAAEELGYQVNMLARGVIQRQSNLVGLVIPGIDNTFVVQLLGPLIRELAAHSLVPLLMEVRDPAQMEESLRFLLQYRIAGVIFASGSPPIELAREYLRLQVPVAMINRDSSLENVDVVSSDNRHGGALAAHCLLAAGARRLAYVNLPTGTYSGVSRGAGFSEAIVLSGQTVSVEILQGTISGYPGGVEVAARLFDRPPKARPDGVFCANDMMAMGLIDSARARYGLRVPEDLALIGFDDVPLADARAFALTTLRQDADRLAAETVARLVERIADPSLPTRNSIVPVELIVRQSCPGQRTEDREQKTEGRGPRAADRRQRQDPGGRRSTDRRPVFACEPASFAELPE